MRDSAELRETLLQALQRLDALGLNRGSTGNLSHRVGDAGMLITPTGMGAADLQAKDFVHVAWNGSVYGQWQPSSEWQFHRALYEARPDLQAIVHVHSVHATALACLDRELPPFHYMVAVAGSDRVPLVPYHLFGSEALSQGVAEAMAEANACLLAHHGLVAAGTTLAQAMKVTVEIESLCQSYLAVLAVGEPALLSAQQMDEVRERFRSYGQSARRGA